MFQMRICGNHPAQFIKEYDRNMQIKEYWLEQYRKKKESEILGKNS